MSQVVDFNQVSHQDITFALELLMDDGTTIELPLDIDLETPTPEEADLAVELWDKTSSEDLAAALIFARLGRPVDDWPALGPVLKAVIEGDQTNLKVRDI